jgi:lathosterol oxidase
MLREYLTMQGAALPLAVTAVFIAAAIAGRSALFVLAAFLWLRFSDFAKRRRIFLLPYGPGQIRSELFAACRVVLVDTAIVLAVLYFGLLQPAASSWQSILLTFVAMFIWFEVWFYTTHRLLHWRPLYIFHRQHHTALVVDPLTSMSFSMLERLVLMGGAIGFAIALQHVTEVSGAGLAAYGLFNYAVNVLGHSNVEVFPRWFSTSALGRYVVTPTYHALHHARFNGHFGLFTSVLDRAFGTVFRDYEAIQARTGAGQGLQRLNERARDQGHGSS